MKHDSKNDTSTGGQSDGVDPLDWLEEVAVRRLTATEIAARRRELVGWPTETRRLEEELALNAMLDFRPGAPNAATNFAALVRTRIETEERARVRVSSSVWVGWRVWLRPLLLGTAILTVTLGLGWQGYLIQHHRQVQRLATSVTTMDFSAGSPELTPESLEDYEVIRRLGATPQPEDEALIAALAEAPTR